MPPARDASGRFIARGTSSGENAAGFSVSIDRVEIDTRALADFMNSPNGPAYRRLFALGDDYKAAAQRMAPVSKPDPIPRRNPVRPGRLRDSIVKRVGTDSRGVYVRVGSVGVPYAMYVHEGTVPHSIVPVRAQYLVFAVGGRTVFAKHVNHPGNAPNRFFIRAAIELVGASNVVTMGPS